MSDFHQITFEMATPLCFIDRPIFDALIVYCWMKEKYGHIPVKLELPPEKLSSFPGLPIDYHLDGYPLSSMMLFFKDLEYEGSWKKRWASRHDALADFKKSKRKVHTGKGALKSYDMPLPLHNIKTVWFYFQGDAKKVEYLIKRHLTGIGKKISQGFGFFKGFEIKPAARQTFDDILLRPIPVASAINYPYTDTNSYVIKYCGFRPSYYLPENQAKCIYPSF